VAQSSIPQLPNVEHFANDVELLLSPDDLNELINFSSLDRPKKGLGLYAESTRSLLIDDNDAGMGSDADIEEASLCGDWEDKDLQESMVKLVLSEGDDWTDEDWVPHQLKKAKKPKISQSLYCLSMTVKSHSNG
jgi:hypothetical protein